MGSNPNPNPRAFLVDLCDNIKGKKSQDPLRNKSLLHKKEHNEEQKDFNKSFSTADNDVDNSINEA